MSFDWNVPTNHNSASTYQLSGLPHTDQIAGGNPMEFPRVTRWVVLKAVGGDITFKFHTAADGFTLANGESTPRLELRCIKIYTSTTGAGTLHAVAGLTTCSADTFIADTKFDYA